MRLADAGRAQQQQRLAVGNPAAGGQLADLALVDRGLGREVEAVEIAPIGEVGDLDRHLDPPLILAGDFPLAQERQRLAQRHIAPSRLVEQTVELVADRRQLQPRQHGEQGIMVDCHRQPPPASCSYSASGRSSAAASIAGAGPEP